MKNKKNPLLLDLWYDHNDNVYLCSSCASWFQVKDETKEFATCSGCKAKYEITVKPKYQI